MSIPPESKTVLTRLIEGNRQFVNGKYDARNITIETLRELATYQNPHACVLSCSDSRVVPELIFEAGIGELFVVRVAGITVADNIIESIEYAIKKLNVPLLILLGHDNCGVMEYAQEVYPKIGEDFNSILNCVYPAIEVDKTTLMSEDKLAKQHTLWVEKVLLEKSKIINKAVASNKLYIAKCHLCHQTGRVKLLNTNLEEVSINEL
jgi:carbonic anhydrase